MLVTSSSNKEKKPPIEEGTYAGYMVWAVNLGMQPHFEKDKNGNPTKYMPKILTAFEIPELAEADENGDMKPRLVFSEYTWSANDRSKLVKHALTINKDAVNIGKSVNISDLLARPVGITLIINDGGYNKIDSLSKLRPKDIQDIGPMLSECFTLDVFNAKSSIKGLSIMGKHTIDKIMSADNADKIAFQDELTERLNEIEEAKREYIANKEKEEAAKGKSKEKVAKKSKPAQEDDEEDMY